MIKKWCTVCKKDTHDTAECWGPGTIAMPPMDNAIFRPAILEIPKGKAAMSPELREALRKVLGRDDIYGDQEAK